MQRQESREVFTNTVMLAVITIAAAASSYAATTNQAGPSPNLPGHSSAMAPAAPASALRARSIQWNLSGSFIKSAIDLNLDGLTGNLVMVGSKGSLGDADLQGYVEGVFVAPTGACPGGQLETGLVEGKTVQRFGNGDLLKMTLTDGPGCLDLATFDFHVTYHAKVIGGTGRFSGATGDVTLTMTIGALVIRPGEIAFGTAVGEADGTIELALP